ncbi:uncharacterized protein LOC130653685 [Hydractinia symbiolongicarpus]|uniref:uncharacterized protein LOC130653685 n=1 Tax=Hydractinia symbiolongicarpus TaxID=13093 RepID=UPI00254B6F28|nr:uncharacterized protein LOC130653685 [Hydractinia symbiolongicarpus]
MTGSGAGNKKLPTCNFFAELDLSKDVSLLPKTASNVPILIESQTVDDDLQENVEPLRRKSAKRKADLQMSVDALLIKALSDDNNKEVAPLKAENDSETSFLLSLVHTLKELSNRKQQYADMKISELFYNLTEEE